ncbi:MAG: hypothetical protein QG587_689, partial [Chloroflexota bacterium]|nr:hypothetical protein [Chloroflexota bacterium]
MTAASPTFDTSTIEVSAAERKALRAARLRGASLAVLGLFALQLSINSLDTPAVFTFWIDKQGG